MLVPAIQLRTKLPAEAAVKLGGTAAVESDVSVLLHSDADVYKPNGEVLCMLRRRTIPDEVLDGAYPALHHLRTYTTTNRGLYSAKERKVMVSADGVVSKNTHTEPVASAIIGYFDRQGGRFPYCRATAFTAKEVEKWATILPMTRSVAALFQATAPERWDRQMKVASETPAEYVIAGTPFTTLTVNNNTAPSGVHKDAGDFKAGLGIIGCLRRGTYSGAWLTFPEYRVGVDLGHGDVIFFNSHDWHGVTPFRDAAEDHERISIVYYFRERMAKCGKPSEEVERAKRVRGAL